MNDRNFPAPFNADVQSLYEWALLVTEKLSGNPVQVYTPTITGVTNISGTPTADDAFVHYIDGSVLVAGRFVATPTAGAPTNTEIALSLPDNLKPTFTSNAQLAGVAATGGAQQSARVLADTTNHRASVQWSATETNQRSWSYIYLYRIA